MLNFGTSRMSLIDFLIFFLYGLVENLILGKNLKKKVSKDSRFSGYLPGVLIF